MGNLSFTGRTDTRGPFTSTFHVPCSLFNIRKAYFLTLKPEIHPNEKTNCRDTGMHQFVCL
ncbi:MAG: hypothetical protein JWQ30_2235 [Sediminibacterium sp.]|nr:hypothetical protein [Sediminibacterium sp.]